jgi:alkylation response protein AidB-like acyl-CoA dehydrogenase
MISFEPTEDQKLITGTVSDFARTALTPRAREFEKAQAVGDEARRAVHELGLSLAAVPEALGGQGLGLLTAVMINEELAYGDPAAPFGLPGFGSYLIAVQELGSDDQAKALLAPFADPAAHDLFGAVAWSERKPNRERAGFLTTAKQVSGGWELTGAKAFVGNADLAESMIVFAQVDASAGWAGLGAFVVKKANPGLRISGRHKTLGLECGHFGEIALESAKVPDADRLQGRGDFIAATTRFFAKYALTVAARQVGLSRLAFDVSREYCDIRKAFGKPIGHFQDIAFTLADRHMDAESARELVRKAAWAWDSGKPDAQCLLATAQAVAHAHQVAMRCADDAVQLHGGAGFMRDVIVEKLMRDAKQMALAGATAEQMDQLAAAVELGIPLDPALVLPTPETQAVLT